MKTFRISMAAALLVLAAATARAQNEAQGTRSTDSSTTHAEFSVHKPDALPWKKGPDSLPPGSEVAILEGDPGKEGFFTMRLRFPAGYEIPPHYHSRYERITVLSGTARLGHGETFDRGKMDSLPTGSYFSMNPGVRHYFRADEATTLQLSTLGPWNIIYVNPTDDPRNGSDQKPK